MEKSSTKKIEDFLNELELGPKESSEVFTKLVDKEYSPLVMRKVTHWGFPIYVGLITDNDLSDLEDFIEVFMAKFAKEGWVNNIQKLRNFAGQFSEALNTYYPKTEGVAILLYADKAFVHSLFGDFMNHHSCRTEWHGLLQMSTGV